MKRWFILKFVRARERADPGAAFVSMQVFAEESQLDGIKEDWAMQLEEQTGVPWVCREVTEMEGVPGNDD